MKKKILSIILSALMIASMLPASVIPAFAAGEQSLGDPAPSGEEPEFLSETIVFNSNETASSEHYSLTCRIADRDGWWGGDDSHILTIAPKTEGNLLIRNIEAIVGYFGYHYADVGVSSGMKAETENVDDGTTIHINNINAKSFSFRGGKSYAQFKNITVYYEYHEHTIIEVPAKNATETEHGISTPYYRCAVCGELFSDEDGLNKLTNAQIQESYTVHYTSEIPAKPATETEHGISTTHYRCNVCGELFSDAEGLNKLTEVQITEYYNVHYITEVPAKPATETEHGISTTHYRCNVCGELFSDADGLNKLTQAQISEYYSVHHVSEIPAKSATETEHGISTTYYCCDICGKFFSDAQAENEITQATVNGYTTHNWSDWSQGDCYGHTRTCTCCEKTETASHTGFADDGICDTCGYEGVFALTIKFNNSDNAENEYYTLTAGGHSKNGWGWNGNNIKISLKSDMELRIKNVNALIGHYGIYYDRINVSSGTKAEPGTVSDGSTVHINNVNDYSFSFSGDIIYSYFKDITIFCEYHEHTLTEISAKEVSETEHGFSNTYYYCDVCGKYFSDASGQNRITKEEADSYVLHHWSDWSKGDVKGHTRSCTCTGCKVTETQAHTGYLEDGVCDVCEYDGIFAETFIFSNSNTVEGNFFTLRADKSDSDGWYCSNTRVITITPKSDCKVRIRNVEGVIALFGSYYGDAAVSSGTKAENGRVADGSTVHINDVNEFSFSISGGKGYFQINKITVFYEFHKHVPTEIPPQAATSEKHGSTDSYYYCSQCKKYFSDEECTIELTETEVSAYYSVHYITEIPVREPTETEHGISTPYYHCDVCGKNFFDSEGENEMDAQDLAEYAVHNWSAEYERNENGHFRTCTVCSETNFHEHTGVQENGYCTVCNWGEKNIIDGSTELTTGRWVVSGNVEFDVPLVISGKVVIFLEDEATLTACKGILLNDGNSLTIEAESSSGDIGRLIATGRGLAAGIGSCYDWNNDTSVGAGALIINGGHVVASGGLGAAGIGGGFGGSGGTVTVNGGIIEATGDSSQEAAGIGGGCAGECGTVIVNNVQMLTAKGGRAIGAGIGCETSESDIDVNDALSVESGANENNISSFECDGQQFAKITFHGENYLCGIADIIGGIGTDVTVILTDIESPEITYTGTTDGTNVYYVEGVSNGTYTLAAIADGAVTRTYTVEITDGKVTKSVELYNEGDVNGDGIVDISDYQQSVNIALDADNSSKSERDLSADSDYSKAVADFDGDGYVDVIDVSYIERRMYVA